MRRSLKTVLPVGVLAAAMLLSSCASTPKETVTVPGGGGTAGPVTQAAGVVDDPQPLLAEDLWGWEEVTVPTEFSDGFFQPCDAPMGERDLQQGARDAGLLSPTNITVFNQISDYVDAQTAYKNVDDVIAPELELCPMVSDDQGRDVTMRALNETVNGKTVARGERVAIDPDTGVRDITVYLAEALEDRVIEVVVQVQLGVVGDIDFLLFGDNVMEAAKAKATGRSIPPVPSPALPEVVTHDEWEEMLENGTASELGVQGDAGGTWVGSGGGMPPVTSPGGSGGGTTGPDGLGDGSADLPAGGDPLGGDGALEGDDVVPTPGEPQDFDALPGSPWAPGEDYTPPPLDSGLQNGDVNTGSTPDVGYDPDNAGQIVGD